MSERFQIQMSAMLPNNPALTGNCCSIRSSQREYAIVSRHEADCAVRQVHCISRGAVAYCSGISLARSRAPPIVQHRQRTVSDVEIIIRRSPPWPTALHFRAALVERASG